MLDSPKTTDHIYKKGQSGLYSLHSYASRFSTSELCCGVLGRQHDEWALLLQTGQTGHNLVGKKLRGHLHCCPFWTTTDAFLVPGCCCRRGATATDITLYKSTVVGWVGLRMQHPGQQRVIEQLQSGHLINCYAHPHTDNHVFTMARCLCVSLLPPISLSIYICFSVCLGAKTKRSPTLAVV